MSFFAGTYGFDLLSLFLLLLGSVFNIFKYTRIITLIIFIIVFYRAFSKNTYKRYQELNKFTSIVNKFLSKFNKQLPNTTNSSLENIPIAFSQLKKIIIQKFRYKIVRCPNCGQKLRLPRGQKKIIVTCKRCRTEFKMRT